MPILCSKVAMLRGKKTPKCGRRDQLRNIKMRKGEARKEKKKEERKRKRVRKRVRQSFQLSVRSQCQIFDFVCILIRSTAALSQVFLFLIVVYPNLHITVMIDIRQ